ncbi:flagellar biosynthetic protein FliQ [Ammonifex thiophilus]|uniref:EscS/YscS/HrcS family type III secretion system export apparatus protein n=1 Tax=Ammonifex thiophilus TaxID=444093 RepID=A0A3D8P5S6_9THEO|nr:flagellar biosynthetic protein FliQ [Ammonifex thiophilus]RDV84683.1 EscS/YscS/HrcS family type III secretion system export apparatus protein [Ammonifex thiophilus]
MSQAMALDLVTKALLLVLLLAGPALLVSALVGLVVGILQATTQIQDQMISFVPKIVAVFLTLALCFPLFLRLMISFTQEIMARFAGITGG